MHKTNKSTLIYRFNKNNKKLIKRFSKFYDFISPKTKNNNNLLEYMDKTKIIRKTKFKDKKNMS